MKTCHTSTGGYCTFCARDGRTVIYGIHNDVTLCAQCAESSAELLDKLSPSRQARHRRLMAAGALIAATTEARLVHEASLVDSLSGENGNGATWHARSHRCFDEVGAPDVSRCICECTRSWHAAGTGACVCGECASFSPEQLDD